MDQLHYYKNNVSPKYWNLQIAANAAVKYEIGIPFPSYIKKIIGICAFTAGVNMDNTAVMPGAQADEYFLSLKRQGGFPYQEIRLDVLTFDINDEVNADTENIFMPMNMDASDIDLQSSFILNPGAASNALMFGFLYI